MGGEFYRIESVIDILENLTSMKVGPMIQSFYPMEERVISNLAVRLLKISLHAEIVTMSRSASPVRMPAGYFVELSKCCPSPFVI